MKTLVFGAAVSLCLVAGQARAAIPVGYTGTPFGGTPRAIPGRIDFEDFDEGGENVAWDVDDHTGNFGEGGCPGNDYREGIHPQLCKTNTNQGEVDTYSAGPMMGMKYPSDAMPQSIYIGYTHGVDWVKVTVDVKTAGMYKLSSTWATEAGGADAIKLDISFNDVPKTVPALPGTGGYHNWVYYPDFATIQLDAGVQVLKFHTGTQHLNYDYLQFSLILPGGGVDDGSGNAGGGGSGGAAATNGGAAGAPSGGAAGTGFGGAPSAGTGAIDPLPTAGAPSGTAGSPVGAAGMPNTPGAAGMAPALNGSNVEQDSSCSIGRAPRHSAWFSMLAMASLGVALLRRRLMRL